jgi:hypothetical protein
LPSTGTPGDHPDDVGRPERNRADQEQADGHEKIADVEDEEICDPEPKHEGDDEDDQRELQCRQIKRPGGRIAQQVDVVGEDKVRHEADQHLVAEEADRQHQRHRNEEEEDEHDSERRDLQIGHQQLSACYCFDYRCSARRP